MSALTLNFRTMEGQNLYLTAYDKNLALWPVPYQSLRIKTGYGTTHVLACGPAGAPPVILLHGFGFSAAMWYPNVAALASDHRVYAVDVMSDFNQSVPDRQFQDRRSTADWLTGVLDELGIERAVVIGHSYGGWLTLNLALCAPERVERIVLLAPAASFVPMVKQFYVRLGIMGLLRTVGAARNFAQWCMAPGHRAPDAIVELFATGMRHYRFGRVIPPDVYTDEELRRIEAPALLLIGDQEVLYKPQAAMARATRLLKQVQTGIIPDASHALTLEQPEAVNRAIRAFLKQNPPRAYSRSAPRLVSMA